MPKYGLNYFNFGLVDFAGEPVSAVSVVQVLDAGTQTDATIYSDADQTAKTNPIVTDLTNGQISFWAAATSYDMIATINGAAIRVLGATVNTHSLPIDANGVLFGPSGGSDTYEYKSADYDVDIQDTGKIIVIDTDAVVITLPVVATAGVYTIVNGADDAAAVISFSPNSSDMIHVPDIAGTDDKDHINTKLTAKKGDFCTVIGGLVSTGWVVAAQRGTWAKQG